MPFTISSDIFNQAGTGSTKTNTGADTGTVNADVVVYGSTNGLVLTGTGAWTLTINGGLFGETFYGLDLQQSSASLLSTVTVGTTGDIFGLANGIRTAHATSVNNSAIIAGEEGSGILENLKGSTASLTITNNATGGIGSLGDAGRYGIELVGSSGSSTATRTINNAGVIAGTLGAINTDPDGATSAVDKVSNSGTLGNDDEPGLGNVFLGLGNDSFTNSGTVYGTVNVGSGNDTVSNSGRIAGDVTLGSGTNTLDNTKTIEGTIFGGANDDTINNTGGAISGVVSLGEGTNALTNSGTIGAGPGTTITGGSGNDTVTSNGGTINGDVDLGAGTDKFLGTGGTVTGNVLLGSGTDTYDSAATIKGYVDLGTGISSITNKGKIEGADAQGWSVKNALGTGTKYTFSNSGTITGGVDLVADADTTSNFSNTGTIGVAGSRVNVLLGDAIDIVSNTGTVHGTFFLGGGADQFTGGSALDVVQGGDGADVINLGGDTYVAGGTVESGDLYFAGGAKGLTGDGTDKIDGGTGNGDVYIAGAINLDDSEVVATESVFINLDTASQSDAGFIWSKGTTIAASTAYGLDVSNSATDAVKDTITNFEWAVGGNGNDVIFGTAGNNILLGDANGSLTGGSDVLLGGAGNDIIYGGFGDDFIVGGAGKDTLYGSTDDESDTSTDFFTYKSASESTVAAAGRDRIEDFDLSYDVLDLSKIGTGLNFIGNNVAFTGVAGQIRTYFTATTTIVQVDLNGDKAADFAVELDGRHTLSAGNFILGGTIGDSGDNTFNGTTAANSYFGAGGADTISGSDGNDVLLGGAGTDTIHGDANNDTISGGSDSDFLYGDAGDDVIIGGGGDDIIEGGTLSESKGDTAVYSQSFSATRYVITDLENGQIQINAVATGEGTDTLTGIESLTFGTTKFAVQLGNAGNELFVDTAGRDIIFGGGGNDTIDATKGGNDIFSGGTNGAKGDTLDFSADTAGVSATLTSGTAKGTAIGSDTISGFENLTGGSGADTLSGNTGANVILGGAGTDTIFGGSGADRITGGTGADKVSLGGTGDGSADRAIFTATNEFGDAVSAFEVALDLVSFGGALNTALDDGVADDAFQFRTGDGADGGFDTNIVNLASDEAVLLAGTNGEGVNHSQLTSAIAIANELNNEFTFSGTGDALVVVNSLDSNSFAVWLYTETSADSGVATTELQLVGTFAANGNVGVDQFELIV